MPAPARRTQRDRREATTKKLLDAATEALIELGFTGATTSKICELAGVSQGGLFRHFPTTESLMVAVGEHVGALILERFRRDFVRLVARKKMETHPLPLLLRLVRSHCRSRENQAFYELGIASRTNPRLRKALAPITARYHADIEELATHLLPDAAHALGPRFPILVDTILAIFDGEEMHRFVLKRPKLEDARLTVLEELLTPLLPELSFVSRREGVSELRVRR